MKHRKLTAIVLALCLLVTLLPLGARAAETVATGTCGENITWTLTDDGTLTVSGEGEAAEYTYSYPWQDYAEQITRVVFESGVTNVPNRAFGFYYPNLESVEIDLHLKVIGDSAFAECTSLSDVKFPYYVEVIGAGAFSNTAITSLNIGTIMMQSIGSGAFSNTPLETVYLAHGLKELGDEVFSGCTNLKSAVLPSSLESVGMHLFLDCTSLEKVNISGALTYIADTMFKGCTSLKGFELHERVESIGMESFAYSGLTSITIPMSVTAISSSFRGCVNLTEITFLGDAPTFVSDSFDGVMATVYYPENNESWSEEVMQDYGGTLTWESYIPTVASGTTGDLTWTLDGRGTLTIFGDGEINVYETGWKKYKDQVKTLVIEEGVTGSVSGFTFYENLASVSLPSTITRIGKDTFGGCEKLTEIVFPENLVTIDSNSFGGCVGLTEVYIPASVTEFGARPFGGCVNLAGIWVDENNPSFTSDANGVMYSKDMTELVEAPGMLAGEYVIPETVTSIRWAAFDSCTRLTSVTIPEGVEWVDMELFYGCTSLREVVLPDSITSI